MPQVDIQQRLLNLETRKYKISIRNYLCVLSKSKITHRRYSCTGQDFGQYDF